MSKCTFNRFVFIGSELVWCKNNQSILRGEWLSDVVINAAQALLNVTYTMSISGLCGVLVLKAPPCIQRTSKDFYAVV